MLTMWIILAAAAATLIWRVRNANATLDRILGDSRDGGAGSESETLPTIHDR